MLKRSQQSGNSREKRPTKQTQTIKKWHRNIFTMFCLNVNELNALNKRQIITDKKQDSIYNKVPLQPQVTLGLLRGWKKYIPCR